MPEAKQLEYEKIQIETKAYAEWSVEKLKALKRKALIDLFSELPSPTMSEMNGEYAGWTLDTGFKFLNSILKIGMSNFITSCKTCPPKKK